jgi:hypothetical protein
LKKSWWCLIHFGDPELSMYYDVIRSVCAPCVIWCRKCVSCAWCNRSLEACEYMLKDCFFVLDAIYVKIWKICLSVVKFSFSKTGVQSKGSQNSKGKITRAVLSFHSKVDAVKCSSQNRGTSSLRFQIAGANSQSWKNRGKITIRLHSRGMITNLPKILYTINHPIEHCSTSWWQVVGVDTLWEKISLMAGG